MEEKKISPKITRENIGKYLLQYQLELLNKSWEDVIDDDKWKFNNTLTKNQYEDFKKYSIKLIKKTFKCNTEKAVITFEWFYEVFGLRIKN